MRVKYTVKFALRASKQCSALAPNLLAPCILDRRHDINIFVISLELLIFFMFTL